MCLLENGVLIAIVAQAIVGLTLVWDKVLLKQTASQSVINYVFWLGAIGIFGCIVGVFGMRTPGIGALLIALASGAADLIGSWAYYKALRAGEASQTLAITGGFGPLATALIAEPLLRTHLGGMSVWGFGLLVAGGFFMFLSEKIDARKILPLVLMAAAFFGLSNVLQRMAFDSLGFPTGFVFFSIGQFFLALCFLARRKWRNEIFQGSQRAQPKSRIAYFTNRFFNGLGAFLISFAVSRAHPALVSAISGVRYATIFAAAYLLTRYKPDWLKEIFTGWTVTAKVCATVLVIAGLAVVGASGQGSSLALLMGKLKPVCVRRACQPTWRSYAERSADRSLAQLAALTRSGRESNRDESDRGQLAPSSCSERSRRRPPQIR